MKKFEYVIYRMNAYNKEEKKYNKVETTKIRCTTKEEAEEKIAKMRKTNKKAKFEAKPVEAKEHTPEWWEFEGFMTNPTGIIWNVE